LNDGIAVAGAGGGSGPAVAASDRLHQGFGFLGAALCLQPARGFRQRFAEIPDDEGTDAGDDEHRTPAKIGNDNEAEQRGGRQPRDHDERHEGEPPPARLRRHEFGQRRIADDDLRAQPKPHGETDEVERRHIRREGGCQRRQTKDHQVDLIGEAAPKAIAGETGHQRPDGQTEKGQRNELRHLGQRREFALHDGTQYASPHVEIVSVEEHAGAD
jgi:hypothetical protein